MTVKNHKETTRYQSGFTLVELSISLIFIAFIILFLSTTLLSIMRTYNKGIWLNQINSAGRQINSDISDQVRFSASSISIRNDKQRLCIGNVAYIWNRARAESFENKYHEEPNNAASNRTTKLRFVRVLDNSGEDYCTNVDLMPKRDSSDTSIMLGPGVVIQKFDASVSSTNLLRINAVFSTEGNDQPEFNPDTERYQCMVGGEFTLSNNQFCAFAEFDIITFRRLGG